jgi:hypothetical protein
VQDIWRTLLVPHESPKPKDQNDFLSPNYSIRHSNNGKPRDSVGVDRDDDYIVLTESDTSGTDSAPGSKRSSFGTKEKQILRMSGNLTPPDLTTFVEDLDKKVVADGGFSSVYIAKYKGEKVSLGIIFC